jgi:hypothetical protein
LLFTLGHATKENNTLRGQAQIHPAKPSAAIAGRYSHSNE